MTNDLYCEFCNKNFVREKNYLKHKCETMKRYELFNTMDGQFAFLAFNTWRKFKNYPPIKVETFATSRYFKSFINFAVYSNKQAIPDRIGFIKLMVEKDLQPFYWCDYDVYDMFLKNFDETYSIDEKIDISLTTLKDWAENHECPINEIYTKIHAIEIIKMITARQLSPCILLPSKKFKHYFMNITDEERTLFSSFVDVPKWKHLFHNQPLVLDTIKKIHQYMDI